MTLNSGFQLFTGEDIDAAITAARISKPRKILQLVADPNVGDGLVDQHSFTFPYASPDNIDVWVIATVLAPNNWNPLPDASLAALSVPLWWDGDGTTITLYTSASDWFSIGLLAVRLVSYE